jgi:hypothetical protein
VRKQPGAAAACAELGREERKEMEEGEINEMRGVGQEKRCLCMMTFSMKNGERDGRRKHQSGGF